MLKSKTIKLGYLITDLNTGGAEMQLFRIVSNLNREQFQPFVISMGTEGVVGEMLSRLGIKVYPLNMKRGLFSFKAIWKLYRILRKERPHVLTMFMYHAYFIGRIVGRIARVPVLVSSIRTANFKSTVRRLTSKYTEFLGDATVVNSRNVADSFINSGIVPERKAIVIANGLDTDKFKPDSAKRKKLRDRIGFGDEAFVWIAVGRLEKAKNYLNMINAFAKIKERFDNAILIIVGDGYLLSECTGLVNDLKINDNVKFMGRRDDIHEILNVADAYVLSSDWEGMPNAVMEAAAVGLPVVSTNVGGVSELVDDQSTGFLVAPGNTGLLADAMIKVMNLPENERIKMGMEGRNIILTKYSIDTVVREWQNLYCKMLTQKGITVD